MLSHWALGLSRPPVPQPAVGARSGSGGAGWGLSSQNPFCLPRVGSPPWEPFRPSPAEIGPGDSWVRRRSRGDTGGLAGTLGFTCCTPDSGGRWERSPQPYQIPPVLRAQVSRNLRPGHSGALCDAPPGLARDGEGCPVHTPGPHTGSGLSHPGGALLWDQNPGKALGDLGPWQRRRGAQGQAVVGRNWRPPGPGHRHPSRAHRGAAPAAR